VVGSDEFATTFDVFAWHKFIEAEYAAADATTSFDDGDVVAGRLKFVGTGEPGESGADYHGGPALPGERASLCFGESIAQEQPGRCGERGAKELTACHCVHAWSVAAGESCE
jgi:hypothetical protein